MRLSNLSHESRDLRYAALIYPLRDEIDAVSVTPLYHGPRRTVGGMM